MDKTRYQEQETNMVFVEQVDKTNDIEQSNKSQKSKVGFYENCIKKPKDGFTKSEITFFVFIAIFAIIPLFCFIYQMLYWNSIVVNNLTPRVAPDDVIISIFVSLAFFVLWFIFLRIPFGKIIKKQIRKGEENKIKNVGHVNFGLWFIFILNLINIFFWCFFGFLNIFEVFGKRQDGDFWTFVTHILVGFLLVSFLVGVPFAVYKQK